MLLIIIMLKITVPGCLPPSARIQTPNVSQNGLIADKFSYDNFTQYNVFKH